MVEPGVRPAQVGLAALSRHLPAVWRGPLSVTCHGPLRTGGLCPHRYWHRSLNPRKLIEVKFSHLSRNMTMQRTMKLYRLPEASGAPGSGQERREGGRPGEPGRAWGRSRGLSYQKSSPAHSFRIPSLSLSVLVLSVARVLF